LKRSNRLVLLIGIFLALVAFVLIAVTLSGGSTGGTAGPTAAPTTTTVVVAAKDLALGTKLTSDAVSTKTIPLADKPGNAYVDTSMVIGQTVRASVSSGQLITSAIVNGAAGTINNIEVPAGFVAVAVQVDQTTGVGTLIKPGDHVDIVMGLTGADKVPLVEVSPAPSPRPGTTAAPLAFVDQTLKYNPTTVKAIVQGLQVLGTLLPPPTANTAPEPSGSASTNTSTTLNGQQQIVILAATTQQAEVIKFSQMDGNLSLVLRATADCQSADGTASPCPVVVTTGITLRRIIDDFGVLPPQVIQVIQPTPYPSPKR
jgi:Flp pilus assembly protein CpaB